MEIRFGSLLDQEATIELLLLVQGAFGAFGGELEEDEDELKDSLVNLFDLLANFFSIWEAFSSILLWCSTLVVLNFSGMTHLQKKPVNQMYVITLGKKSRIQDLSAKMVELYRSWRVD